MKRFITLSLETNLFFARIMKEHSLFLQAGFPCKDTAWIQKADFFRRKFEELLRETVRISNGMVNCNILESDELVTRFTIPAEERTQRLTGISIDSRISMMEQTLQSGYDFCPNDKMVRRIRQLNEKALNLTNGLIRFKENILCEVSACRLFTSNYPLLIEHIIREAKLYCSILTDLQQNRQISCDSLHTKEEFWNQIMMEHALFIRGLLDPSETQLIETANDFAMAYKELLKMAKEGDCQATDNLTQRTLEETLKYRDFKTAGTVGIIECNIASLILPLLADHVLREANYYIRILENACTK